MSKHRLKVTQVGYYVVDLETYSARSVEEAIEMDRDLFESDPIAGIEALDDFTAIIEEVPFDE